MKKQLRLLFVSLLLAAGLLSCSGRAGYGVMQWSVPEYALTAGDIVPVFVRSNISGVYIVGVGRTRAELPLWQIRFFKSRSQAKKFAATLEEYRYSYARVKVDGLPVRSAAENTARQVYRLKQDEVIKILRKGDGAPVMARDAQLEGDWLEVMTDDGTVGWSFSYNLNLYDERGGSGVADDSGANATDPVLEGLLSRSWYPDHYRAMIANNRIDLSRISASWGFFTGQDSGVARIENENGVTSFTYSAILKNNDNSYRFEGSSLTVQVRREDSILVQYTDSFGMPQVAYFTALDTTPDLIIAAEQERRSALLDGIRSFGPEFTSGNYGVLQFLEGGKFLWSGYQLLSPSIIPARSGAGGIVDQRYFIGEQVAGGYTGVLSFKFESTSGWVHFLYTAGSDGIRLEHVSDSNIRDSVVVSRNMTPTVLFFTPSGRGAGN